MFEVNFSLIVAMILVLYISGAVSHFFASLSTQNIANSLEGLIRSPQARKEIKKLKDETKLQTQLSLLWPYALYLIIRKK